MAEAEKKKRDHIALVKETGEEILKDVVVPKKFYKRIDFGVPLLNEIFGGQDTPGLLPGATILFTGMPGAGKSTMALQLADLLHVNAQRTVHYNMGEENKYAVKMRADRMGVTGEFTISSITDINKLLKFVEERGIEVVIQDSIQSLTDGDLRGSELLKSVAKKIQNFGKDNDVNWFVIGHITKGGNFAGPQEIKHDLDAHAHMKVNFENGTRIFELQKNRWGPACIPYEFPMTGRGLDFNNGAIADTEEETGVGVSRAAERREGILKIIKDRLIEGDKISGYCFERLNVDCSGGFWRGMVEKAKKQLKSEGYDIGEDKNGPSGKNRTHVFVRSRPEEKVQ